MLSAGFQAYREVRDGGGQKPRATPSVRIIIEILDTFTEPINLKKT